MFEDLSKRINMQNLSKIKKLNSKPRYQNQPQYQQARIQNDREDDDFFDDLHIQMVERQQNFHQIMENHENKSDDDDQQYFIKRNNRKPQNNEIVKKLKNQLQLSEEKQKILQITHRRQFQYQQQLFQKRQEGLKIQIARLNLLTNKNKKDSEEIKQLKKQISTLLQLKDNVQLRLQNTEYQLTNLKLKMKWHKEAEQNWNNKNMSYERNIENDESKNVQILDLQNENNELKRICKEKQRKNQQLYERMNKIKQEFSCKINQRQILYKKIQQDARQRQQRLENEVVNLKKRNQFLEETFIEKMSEITKIQANILTNNNSSTNIHPTRHLNTTVNHQNHDDQTLNLHQQSPIRPQAHHFSERKNKKYSKQQQGEVNPQTTKKNKLNNHQEMCECCATKTLKLKEKLQKANRKIVQLLQYKVMKGKCEKNIGLVEKRERVLSYWENR